MKKRKKWKKKFEDEEEEEEEKVGLQDMHIMSIQGQILVENIFAIKTKSKVWPCLSV